MKAARMIAYGVSGVILGLLLENTALRASAAGGRKIRGLKAAAGKKLRKG